MIYDLLDDMRALMEGQLSSVEERIPLGQAEVRRPACQIKTLVIVLETSRMGTCFDRPGDRSALCSGILVMDTLWIQTSGMCL